MKFKNISENPQKLIDARGREIAFLAPGQSIETDDEIFLSFCPWPLRQTDNRPHVPEPQPEPAPKLSRMQKHILENLAAEESTGEGTIKKINGRFVMVTKTEKMAYGTVEYFRPLTPEEEEAHNSLLMTEARERKNNVRPETLYTTEKRREV